MSREFRERLKTWTIVLLIGLFMGYQFGQRQRAPRMDAGGVLAPAVGGGGAPGGAPAPAARPAGGTLILSDFESEADLAKWETKGVSASLVSEHATDGHSAVQLLYGGSGGVPGFMLEDYLGRNTDAGRWNRYASLSFDLYNAGDRSERFIVQIKDAGDKRYKKEFHIEAGEQKTVKVSVSEIRGILDVSQIRQVNLFRWKPTRNATVILDQVRLVGDDRGALEPPGESAAVAEATADHEAGSATADADGTTPSAVPPRVRAATRSPQGLAGDWFAAERRARWEQRDPATGRSVVRVPLQFLEETSAVRRSWPLSGGIPLPYGQLREASSVRLKDRQGVVLPLQVRPLARWQDGSLKWLLLDTQADSAPQEHPELWLEYGDGVGSAPAPATGLEVIEEPETITVVTGPLKLTVRRSAFNLVDGAWLDLDGNHLFDDAERVVHPGDMALQFRGQPYRSSLDQAAEVTVEERGPLRVTLKATGWYRNAQGKPFCQFIVRVQAFAQHSFIRLYHTFVYTGYPANVHHYAYEGLRLPENEPIDAISVTLPFSSPGPAAYRLADDAGLAGGRLSGPVHLWQREADRLVLQEGKTTVREAKQAEGWIDVSNDRAGMMLFVRHGWQQYPKAWSLTPRADGQVAVTLDLWPAESGALDLQTSRAAKGPDDVARGSAFGLAKTHELTVYFHPAQVAGPYLQQVAAAFQETPLLTAAPDWMCETSVFGHLVPSTANVVANEAEAMLGQLFDWARRQPEAFGWYGMLNFGDTLSWYRKEAYDKSYADWGWHPEGRWGWFNTEGVGLHGSTLLEFVRTGDLDYFRFGERNARHVMDVDTVHYDTVAHDPRLRPLQGGVGDPYSRVGSMHRHSADHWSGRNEEASHTHAMGLLWYYYLTGYERAFDVVKEVGEFLLRDPVTYYQHPNLAPQRACANVFWGDVLLYEATGDPRFKQAAERWANIFVRGQVQQGSWLENYDPTQDNWRGGPDRRFMAFHTLPALIAYHRLTGSPEVADSIVRGSRDLMRQKYMPFFDALAYSYALTGDEAFLSEGRQRLNEQMKGQRHVSDPLFNGMVYQKSIYDRVPPLLYNAPYLIAALADPKTSASLVGQPAVPSPQDPEGAAPEPPQPSGETQPAEKGAQVPDAAPEDPRLQIGIASSLERVFREPGGQPAQWQHNPVQLALAANERESVQLVLSTTSEKPLELRVTAEDLVRRDGAGRILASAVTWSVVDYVRTTEPAYTVPFVGWWPDPLPRRDAVRLERKTPQPIWITIHAPPGTPAGTYDGALAIQSRDGTATAISSRVRLQITVWDFELPATSHLATAFDFYPNRLREAYETYFPGDAGRWRNRWERLEGLFSEDMLEHRISPMVNVEPERKASLQALSRYVERGLSAFAVGARGGGRGNNWPKEEAELQALVPTYRRYAETLEASGWLDRAYVYTYDEPRVGNPRPVAVARMIHQADSRLRNLVTLQGRVDVEANRSWLEEFDIVVLRNVAFEPETAEALRAMGKEVWLYVSGPKYPYPTLVIDYPTMAYRILPWMCWKYGAKGLLYWCVNYWTTNPWENPMNTKWGQNGNGSLYYPGAEGPVTSIRMEILRDGMEDYEYLHLLADLTAQAGRIPGTEALVAEAEALLRVEPPLVESLERYAKDPDALLARRRAIAEVIERLRGFIDQAAAGRDPVEA